MATGFRGTFVISWSQTETDGVRAAPLELLATGVSWRWTGEAVRVDGPQHMLVLDGAEGMAEVRRRASRMVRRLVGIDLAGAVGAEILSDEPLPDQSFVLTDGTSTYTAVLVEGSSRAGRLVMFADRVPAPDRDLWVVRMALDRTTAGGATSGGIICFTPGTRIATADGPCLIEGLRPGDRILTKDNGPQEVLWTGQRRMSGARLYAMPHLRPVRLRMGVFGVGRPDADLVVSPQHRMLVKGAAARALFNTDEVLVAAEALVNDTTVTVDSAARDVTYVHVLLERHNIVWANGLETESFHPSNAAMETIDPAQRAALFEALPAVADNPHAYGDYARRNLSASEAAILRHELRG